MNTLISSVRDIKVFTKKEERRWGGGRRGKPTIDSITVKYLKQLRKISAAVWFCLGLIQLKSIPRTEYIVLPYNIRMPALWTPFRGWILSCQKWTIQDNAYTTSNKSFSIQKLTPQAENRWTVIKMIMVGKAQRTKWLPKSIFYRWYDQWILSKSVKVQ